MSSDLFVPEPGLGIAGYYERGDRKAVHHLIRYEWARRVLVDMCPHRVLDVACGSGYGSEVLARALPDATIVGIDADTSVALSTRDAPNLEFVDSDVARWPDALPDVGFDCIVSFDTIARSNAREIVMQHITEHLAIDGALLLSTPARSASVLHPGTSKIKIEYSRDALYDFLRRYFVSVGTPDDDDLPHVEVFEQVNRDATPDYYLLRMNPLLCRGPIRIEEPRTVA